MLKIGPLVILGRRELDRLAYRDGLTGLANRKMFDELLAFSVAEADRYQHKVGVMFLDLNGFKKINDRLGHHVGDQVLQIFGGALAKAVRHSDVPARFGGDEFAVILPNIRGQQDLRTVAAKLAHLTDKPIDLAGRQLWLMPSIGGSIYPDDSQDLQELVQLADKAMYHAKADLKQVYRHHGEAVAE